MEEEKRARKCRRHSSALAVARSLPFIDSRVGNEEDFSPTELAHRRMERG